MAEFWSGFLLPLIIIAALTENAGYAFHAALGAAAAMDGHCDVAGRDLAVHRLAVDGIAVIHHDHHADQALRPASHQIHVEADQAVAGLHRLPILHMGGEALAVQADGVDAQMQQHLRAAGGADGAGVAGAVADSTTPSQGLRSSFTVGSMAMPVPTSPWAKAGSGTSVSGMAHPASGAASVIAVMMVRSSILIAWTGAGVTMSDAVCAQTPHSPSGILIIC